MMRSYGQGLAHIRAAVGLADMTRSNRFVYVPLLC